MTKEQLKDYFLTGEIVTESKMHDLIDVIFDESGGTSSGSYDVGPLGFTGLPDSEETDWIIVPRNIQIEAGSSGFAHSLILATSECTFTLYKNNDIIGTVVFDENSNTGTLDIPLSVTVNAGDRIALSAPLIPDNTIENIQVVILGELV